MSNDTLYKNISPSAAGSTATIAVDYLVLTDAAGFGSSNTQTRRFTNIQVQLQGSSAMILTQDSTNGDTVTIKNKGLYAVTFQEFDSGGAPQMAIAVNISYPTHLGSSMLWSAGMRLYGLGANNFASPMSTVLNLAANDVVSFLSSSTLAASGGNKVMASILRIANVP